jgi:hypothetical protein
MNFQVLRKQGKIKEVLRLDHSYLARLRPTVDMALISILSHPIYKDINRAIIYAPGSSHAYIQQNYQDITTHIMK